MRRLHTYTLTLLLATGLATAQPVFEDAFESPGGSYTSFTRDTGSLSEPAPVLTGSNRENFFIGKALFESSLRTNANELQLRYNALSCTACHRPSEANTQVNGPA